MLRNKMTSEEIRDIMSLFIIWPPPLTEEATIGARHPAH
jgi:hypothetical protein